MRRRGAGAQRALDVGREGPEERAVGCGFEIAALCGEAEAGGGRGGARMSKGFQVVMWGDPDGRSSVYKCSQTGLLLSFDNSLRVTALLHSSQRVLL